MNAVTHYPGPSAIFVHRNGDWNYHNSDFDLCRELNFKSTVKGSTIQRFSVLGYKSGRVSIFIEFGETGNENKPFIQFLEANGIRLDYYDRLGNFLFTDSPQITSKVFQILSKNNQIPPLHQERIARIVACGYC